MTQTENTEPTGSKSGKLSDEEIDRIVEMAWEDRTPFDAILMQFGVNESEVIELMRSEMKPSSFRMWRARVQGRTTKHMKKRTPNLNEDSRFKCSRQRSITNNKISKRK
ncbi:MAG: TIGR03643 family protein [Bacteroidota bacterium]